MSSRSVNNFEITIQKDELLLTLRENRLQHDKNYKEALEIYKEECEEALRSRQVALQEGTLADPDSYLSFHIPTPASYLHVYDQLLAMLDMTSAEVLTINGEQYRNWVQDEWDWTRHYASNTLSKLR